MLTTQYPSINPPLEAKTIYLDLLVKLNAVNIESSDEEEIRVGWWDGVTIDGLGSRWIHVSRFCVSLSCIGIDGVVGGSISCAWRVCGERGRVGGERIFGD